MGAHPLAPGIDLARDRLRGWTAVRATGGVDRIEGLTRWSDWVAVRGALLAQGYRVAAEQRVGSAGPEAALFRWSLRRRAGLSR